MAKHLTADKLLQIKTHYEAGKSMRAIGALFDISGKAVEHHVKKNGWNRKLLTQVTELKEIISEISQQTSHAQLPYVGEKLKTLFDTQLEAFGIVKDTSMLALKIHRNITTMVHNGLANRTYKPEQGAAILKMQGLDVAGSLKALGIKEDKPVDHPEQDSNKLVIEYVRKE